MLSYQPQFNFPIGLLLGQSYQYTPYKNEISKKDFLSVHFDINDLHVFIVQHSNKTNANTSERT